MKTKSSLLGMTALLFLTLGFVKPGDWFLLTSEAFQIEFPKKPIADTKAIASDIGPLEMKLFIHDASQGGKDDNFVYMLMHTEYPDSLVNSETLSDVPAFLKASAEGAANNVGGKLLSDVDIELDGFPGKEIKIDFRDGLAIIKMRFYLVKNKMYVIQAITETGKFPNKSVDRFMDSFKLLK
ncbi:MAG: hypothetical protein HUU01_07150 [Saprospiraceae bacterium]|nr:hypothetical protein [Saprospiraceae bacterium]